jgi:hypothetical protein
MGGLQGIFAKLVADTSPAEPRGTDYGFFNLWTDLAMLAMAGAGFAVHVRIGVEVDRWSTKFAMSHERLDLIRTMTCPLAALDIPALK